MNREQRRHLLRAAALAGAAALALPVFSQEAWPSRPIRVIVPYPAGGTTDQLARALQQPLAELLGQPIVIENRAGAGGTLGTDLAAKATPDGYTFVFGNSGPNAIAGLLRRLPYDPLKDLRPLSTVAIVPMNLAVPAQSPHRSAREFIAWARTQGSGLNYGSVGNGSMSHLSGELFNDLAGLKLQHIPYNGGAPLMTAFGGGQVQMAFVTGLDGAAMAQAGRVRYLAVASPSRTEIAPGLPALAEEIPGYRAITWFGVLAPRGVSDDIAARMHAAIVRSVARPEFRKLLADRNVEARSSTPQELEAMIRDEMTHWGAVVTKANIKE